MTGKPETRTAPRPSRCGITRTACRLAAELGVWAIGFIFWPETPASHGSAGAPRHRAWRCRRLSRVGVFVDESPATIEAVATTVRLGAVQLHGRRRRRLARALSCRVIKAMRRRRARAASRRVAGIALVLLDAHDPARRGGTGQRMDWTVAAASRAAADHSRGGLKAENVAARDRSVQPSAIDVSSGVESAPGVKDPARLRP